MRTRSTIFALLLTTGLAGCGGETPGTASPARAPGGSSSPAAGAETTADAEAGAAAREVAEAAEPEAPDIEARGSEAAANSDGWWSALPREEWSAFERISLRDDWFEVFRIRDGIFAIYEPGQFEEVISYLVVGEEQALLFDTGLGIGNILGVVKQLTSLPVTVLNSHSHYDHVGGNHQFPTIMGRNHPYAKERSRGLGNEMVGEYALGDWIWKATPPDFVARDYATKAWEYSRWVKDGQFIDLGGVSLEVIYTPGHSPDSLVLVDHQRRIMFTGDTFYLAPLYAHTESASFTDYAASAAQLAGLSVAVDELLMSHNSPLAGSEYLQKLDAAFRSIEDGTAAFTRTADGREYRFEGFSVLTRDPPVAEDAEIELL